MDIANRLLWTVIGVMLTLAGGLGAALGLGPLPQADRDVTLLPEPFLEWWRSLGALAWTGLTAAGLLLSLLGLWLSRAQLRSHTGRPVDDLTRSVISAAGSMPTSNPEIAARNGQLPGQTRVRSHTLVRCIERDLARHPKVHRTAVALTGATTSPRLHARLEVTAGTNLDHLQRHVATSIERFTATTGLSPAVVQVLLRLSDRHRSRVQ